MPRRKQTPEPTWITAKQAAQILSEKIDDNRVVNDRYIRRLAVSGKIASKFINATQSLYSKEDVEAFNPGERVGRPRRFDVGSPRRFDVGRPRQFDVTT